MNAVQKVDLDFQEIKGRLEEAELPEVDLVVGIHSGGKVPASLAAWKTGSPLAMIHINYRDESNTPRYEEPQLLKEIKIDQQVKKILLVDDVAVTGKTFALAKSQLEGYDITTLAMKGKAGKADILLFPEIRTCVNWPWN